MRSLHLQSAVPARYRFFFFNDTATTEIYTLSLHDALPISRQPGDQQQLDHQGQGGVQADELRDGEDAVLARAAGDEQDRKSTRLNSSHANISYAVFCLQKKTSSLTGARARAGPYAPRGSGI